MAKKVFLLVLVIFLLLPLGCGSSSSTEEAASNDSQEQKVALPTSQPTLVGKVKEIIGNEVTVYKAELY